LNSASTASEVPPTILVVDDDWINRELMEAVLGTAGYRVLLANDSASALEMAQTEQPNLILIDVRLSYPTEGYDLCRQLRTQSAAHARKMVMLTAMESPQDRVQAVEAGADGYLSRMLEMSELLRRIEAYLTTPDQPEEAAL
jgi:two-component system response regulator MtrA